MRKMCVTGIFSIDAGVESKFGPRTLSSAARKLKKQAFKEPLEFMWINERVNVETKPLEVPYLLDESQGHNYENLRDNPCLIDQLPEPRRVPALYDFMKEINSPKSIFQTFGCEKWQQPFSHPSMPPEFSWQSGSYIEFAFADVNLCRSQDPLWKLIDQYRVYGHRCIEHSMVQVIFEVRAATNAELGNWWTLEFWNYGIGQTKIEADQWWAEGIGCFKRYLLEQSKLMLPQPVERL